MKPKFGRSGRSRTGNYAIGYGRPPVQSRFKPGQSGNPKGRKKGQKSLTTLLRQIMNEKVQIREGENVRTVTRLEAMLHGFFRSAMKGNSSAFTTAIALYREQEDFTPLIPKVVVHFGDDDDDEKVKKNSVGSTTKQEGNSI